MKGMESEDFGNLQVSFWTVLERGTVRAQMVGGRA
jgi:hypothetical protein